MTGAARAWAAWGAALLLCGCGGGKPIYPVEGHVLDLDGKPIPGLTGATVEFESLEAKVSASGGITEDGTFRLTTERREDGAWLGKHRVLIARHEPNPDTKPPRAIPAKYESFETSGLTADVKAESNRITFKVERLKGKQGK